MGIRHSSGTVGELFIIVVLGRLSSGTTVECGWGSGGGGTTKIHILKLQSENLMGDVGAFFLSLIIKSSLGS